MMLQLHLLMTLAHVIASVVVAAAAVVVVVAFVATVVLVVMYAADLVGFATSYNAHVDAIDLDAAASGDFIVLANPNGTDD